jgi:hypothetical protein
MSAGPSKSAWRLFSVYEAFDLGSQLCEHLAECRGPVLLVDNLVDSGWTMTVAPRLLRRAPAPPPYYLWPSPRWATKMSRSASATSP